tara:strand:+ start:530 stop:940 length:411 start_codon:yes stop_codon:yes gene_type:complete
MKLEFKANTNTTSSLSIFVNNQQIFTNHNDQFDVEYDIATKFENTIDIHWQTELAEDIHLNITEILLHNQKLNMLKSVYMPTQDAKKFIKHQMFHNGKLLWPGIVRFYFRVIKSNHFANKKLTDSTMIRKYNFIYV